MPKGGKKKYKGLHRRFTAPEEIEKQLQGSDKGSDEGTGSSDESSDEQPDGQEEGAKKSGVHDLIEVSNPNYQKECNKKISQLTLEESATAKLTRRQREEMEAEKAKKEYERLHAQGKTTEAQADLARLALVRREREEAARRREAEKEAKEAAKAARQSDVKDRLQEKSCRGPHRGRHRRKQKDDGDQKSDNPSKGSTASSSK